MFDFVSKKVLAGARRAARSVCRRPTLETWTDDITQQIALFVWELHLRGQRCSYRMYWLFAIRSLRAIYGPGAARRQNGYFPWERSTSIDHESPFGIQPINELFPIALWRLQAAWPMLDDFEKGALSDLVLGDPHPMQTEVLRNVLSLLDTPNRGQSSKRPINSKRRDATQSSRIVRDSSRGKARPWLAWVSGRLIGRFPTHEEAKGAVSITLLGDAAQRLPEVA
jgi:hypothetical protein